MNSKCVGIASKRAMHLAYASEYFEYICHRTIWGLRIKSCIQIQLVRIYINAMKVMATEMILQILIERTTHNRHSHKWLINKLCVNIIKIFLAIVHIVSNKFYYIINSTENCTYTHTLKVTRSIWLPLLNSYNNNNSQMEGERQGLKWINVMFAWFYENGYDFYPFFQWCHWN